MVMEGIGAELADIDAVESEDPAIWEVHFGEERGDGGFAASCVSDEGDGLARQSLQVDVVEDWALGFIRERDVLEEDVDALGVGGGRSWAGQGEGVWGIFPSGFGVEEAEDAFCPDHGGEGCSVKVSEGFDGFEEESGKEEELDDARDGGSGMKGEDPPATDQEDECGEKVRFKLEQGEKDGRGAGGD